MSVLTLNLIALDASGSWFILICVSCPNTIRLQCRHTQKQMLEGFSEGKIATITLPNQLLDIYRYVGGTVTLKCKFIW